MCVQLWCLRIITDQTSYDSELSQLELVGLHCREFFSSDDNDIENDARTNRPKNGILKY